MFLNNGSGDPQGRRIQLSIDKYSAYTEMPFSLTSDGILRTTVVFDFEKKNKYSIRVRPPVNSIGNFEKIL